MDPILIYYIKINIGIILFYGFYKLFFTRDTLFKMRRTALITFFAVAFIYPLMNIETWMRNFWEVDESIVTYNLIMSEFSISAPVDNTPFYGTWDNLVIIILLGGIFVLSGRLITDLIRIGLLRRNSEIISVQGIQCYRLSGDQAPFSFFRSIFINPDCHTAAEQQEIITHELSHARQHHSVDVIISEVACIALWINPFAWLLAREIRQNLEYLADQNVIKAGFNPKNYQYHLLGLTYTKAAAKLYNNFNVLPLKNRIRMMNKKRTSRAFSVKYALFAPLAFALLFVSNIELIAREANNWMETPNTPSQESMGMSSVQPVSGETTLIQEKALKGKIASISYPQNQKNDPETQVFSIVENMPQFPGGEKGMLQYLAKSVKYPVKAQENKEQGRVIVSYIINKSGKVTDAKIEKSVSPSLDAEALRVVNSMPNWTPGKQRGLAVNVKYNTPVLFRLQGNQSNPATATEMPGSNDIVVVGYAGNPATTPQIGTQVYTAVDEMPKFPGGEKALLQFLRDNVKYPEAEAKKGIQGRVICSFTITKEGKIANPKVVRGIDPALDAEAIRVIESMPDWTPGKQKGKLVNVKYTVPINFRIPENKEPQTKPSADFIIRNSDDKDLGLKPLVIIDGKEHTYTEFETLSKTSLKPEMIQQISVLKDKSAITQYGEKAKGGVLIITTKK